MIAAALLLAALAAAEEPPKPGLLSSSQTNLRHAVASVCLPWVERGDEAGLHSAWGVASVGWGPQALYKRLAIPAHLIGTAGRVNVGVGAFPSGDRQCIVEVNEGRPSGHRADVLKILSDAPENFAPARTPYPPKAFAARDMLCAATPSPVAVLMSTEADGDNRMPKLLITVLQGKARSWRCDHDAPPPSPEPPPSPLPEAAKP